MNYPFKFETLTNEIDYVIISSNKMLIHPFEYKYWEDGKYKEIKLMLGPVTYNDLLIYFATH